MIVTSTELQNNFGKYVELMEKEPVVFTKNGKIVGKLVPVVEEKRAALEKLEMLKEGLKEVDEQDLLKGKLKKYGL
jgi:prevent-host-death family protein